MDKDCDSLLKESASLERRSSPVQSSEDENQFEGQSPVEADVQEKQLKLDILPSEILLHICSFLDAKIVICRLSLTCRAFYHLMNDPLFWKVRIKKRWPKKYPAIPVNDDEFDWKSACISREEEHKRWYNHEEEMDFFRFREGIFAAVDSVKIMEGATHVAVGSRDRYLNVLDLRKLDPNEPEGNIKNARVFTKMDAHKGWIWSMASIDGLLATGSWDTFIKFWDMEAGGQEIRMVKCKSAVLALHYEPQFMAAGGFDKKVYHIDPRTATIIAEKRIHKKPVLDVTANDKFIITGSEDSTIAIYDRRADAVLKTLELAEYPMSMSYHTDQLWVGDKSGLLHLIDANDGDFSVVETYNVGHSGKITGVHQTTGALFTCSTDNTIKVLEPNADPGPITTLKKHTAEVASMDYSNGVLVSGSCDISIGIWKPKMYGL